MTILKNLHVLNIVSSLKKFKQKHGPKGEELYSKLINEEVKEFNEANTKAEKLKEAIDLIWVAVGYIWSTLNGKEDKINKAFDEVYSSNLSKICFTYEEARKTKEYYKTEKNKETVIKEYDDGSGKYYIIYTLDGKYKKGINYKPANTKKFFEDGTNENS